MIAEFDAYFLLYLEAVLCFIFGGIVLLYALINSFIAFYIFFIIFQSITITTTLTDCVALICSLHGFISVCGLDCDLGSPTSLSILMIAGSSLRVSACSPLRLLAHRIHSTRGSFKLR